MTNKSITCVVPVLPVSDLTRAISFYHRLGFTSKRYKGGDNYAFIHRDEHEIHLTKYDGLIEQQNHGGAYFYLSNGTAAALEAEFLSAGIALSERLTPREWRMNEFALRDPDGNQLVFGEGIS